MKNLIYWILMLSSIGMVSCYKDLGNYTYGDKPTIQIDSLRATYAGMSGIDTLRIEPVITSERPIAHCEWQAYNMSLAAGETYVLDSTENLSYPIGLPQGTYKLLLNVTDIDGYTEIAESELTVTTAYSEGWLVLKGVDGETELDLYPTGKSPAQDLFSKLYGRKLKGKPVGLSIFPQHNFRDTSGTALRSEFAIFPISEEESPMLRLQDMQWVYDYEDLLYDGPQDGEKPLKYVYGGSDFKGMITDTYVRCSQTNGPPGAPGKWGAPAVTDLPIKPSPYISYVSLGSAVIVMYDNLNSQFLRMDYFGQYAHSYKAKDADGVETPIKPFDLNSTILYMKRSVATSGSTYAVLEHKDSHARYVFELNAQSSTEVNPIVATDTVETGLKLNEAKLFGLHENLPYLYYAVGGECYLYDMDLQKEENLNLSGHMGNEEVTFIEHIYWRGNPADKRDYLVVATHANGHYKVYLYPTRGGRPDLTKEVRCLEGEGKVCAIHYVCPQMSLGFLVEDYYPYN